MLERIKGGGLAQQTPIGWVPSNAALLMQNVVVSPARVWESLLVNRADWLREADAIGEHFARFGDKLPPELDQELAALRQRLA